MGWWGGVICLLKWISFHLDLTKLKVDSDGRAVEGKRPREEEGKSVKMPLLDC